MPLMVPPVLAAGDYQTNVVETSTAGRKGTSVTGSGTAHEKGSWTTILSSVGAPTHGIWGRVMHHEGRDSNGRRETRWYARAGP